MGDKSLIEWTDATWNPVTGCTKVSAGCKNCYAERVFPRTYAGQRVGIVAAGSQAKERPRKFTDVWTHHDRLDLPLRWRKPRRIFVNSMSDLFHEDVPDEFIDSVFAVMALCQGHTFQILTKRPKRMHEYMTQPNRDGLTAVRVGLTALDMCCDDAARTGGRSMLGEGVMLQGSDINPGALQHWPMANVWLGVSVEDQATADERIPLLLQTPAAVRFVSYEPALGPVILRKEISSRNGSTPAAPESWSAHDWLTGWQGTLDHKRRGAGHAGSKIDWLIAGGESGPNARPSHPDWFRSVRDQCAAAGVPFFFKQWGEWANSHVNAKPFSGCVFIELDGNQHRYSDGTQYDASDAQMWRIGKKAAGRLLDNRTHDEYPA